MHTLGWLFFLGYIPFLELRFMLKLSNERECFPRFQQALAKAGNIGKMSDPFMALRMATLLPSLNQFSVVRTR